MVKGILADNDVRGQVDYLAMLLQIESLRGTGRLFLP
jgi:hypothetical protein